MALKKMTKQPIINGLDETHIVEKARPLLFMKEVPFGLGELKILDTYLSRINARDEECTTVRFSKEEYEDLIGIERMHPERLSKYVDNMMGKTITVPDENASGGWEKYVLFDYSRCFQDEETGQWWIDLSCTTKAKSLFFNIESIGYIRYQLKNILPLTSKYSVLLYVYLLDNRFRSCWDISLKELREVVLRCNSDFYKEFKRFNSEILKRVISEINAKTDLTFEYTAIKVGRKISKIQFNLIKQEVCIIDTKKQNVTISDSNSTMIEFNSQRDVDSTDIKPVTLFENSHDEDYNTRLHEYLKGMGKNYDEAQQLINEANAIILDKQRSGEIIRNTYSYIKGIINNKLEKEKQRAVDAKEKYKKPEREHQSYDFDEFESFAVNSPERVKRFFENNNGSPA